MKIKNASPDKSSGLKKGIYQIGKASKIKETCGIEMGCYRVEGMAFGSDRVTIMCKAPTRTLL